MTDDHAALIAESKTWTSGLHMESQAEAVTSIIRRLASALEAVQQTPADPYCREESCQYRNWTSGSMPTHRRGSGCPEPALEAKVPAVQQTPAVDREALAEAIYKASAGTPWDFAGDQAKSDFREVAASLLTSGILLDAAEVEARGLERLIERVTDDGLVQVFGGEKFVSVALLVSEARTQAIRKGRND